jgi:hypothetical protein
MPRVLNFLNYKRVGPSPGADYIGRKNRYHHLPESKWANRVGTLRRNAQPRGTSRVHRLQAQGLSARYTWRRLFFNPY